ncbi:MAG: hypothetical protein GY928_14885 [Colwellia sp.]|nr:hypothetical protein [Colwellia sp.]
MENQLVKAKDYGLEENKAIEIESKFAPMIAEKEALVSIYNDIITSELTPGLCAKAKDLRNKLVKVRTGISKIHKTQKAFYLAGGRFVDAWKNANAEPVTQMEEKLSEIEKHFENIEKERINNLRIEREEKLFPLLDEYTPMTEGLGDMSDDMWEAYYSGKKTAFDKRKEEARLVEEKEKAEEARLKAEREAELVKQDRIRKENERLKKEAAKKEKARLAELDAIKAEAEAAQKERERLAKIEADKAEKKRADEVEKRRMAAIKFLFDNDFKNTHGGMEAKDYHHFIEALHYSELDTDNELELFKNDVLKTKKIEEEKAKREKLEAELKAKEEAELKAKQEEEARKQAELNKGDAAKVKDLISELETLKTKYSFKSAKNNKMYSDVGLLIDKVVNHIKK